MGGYIGVGWGMADITPRGGAIALYGQWEDRVYEEIHDPLYAVAMVLQSEKARTIWVACDLCVVSKALAGEVKRLLAASLPGFKGEELILSATHIHTGPNVDPGPNLIMLDDRGDPPGSIPTEECYRQAALGIEKAVLQAAGAVEPSVFEAAVSYTITGVSRRASYKDGSGVMYGNLNKPDFAGMEGRDGGPVELLYVRRASDNGLTGVVAAVPCTAQADEGASYATADYWATAREVVKKGLGEGIAVLGLIRSAGDLSPHTMVDCGKLVGPVRGEEGAVIMGERVGEAIVRAAGDVIAAYGEGAEHRHACSRVALPLWTATEAQYGEAKRYLAGGDAGKLGELPGPMARASALARVKRYEYGAAEYEADFYAVRVGDVAFVTNPFEMYIEYADRIRVACPEAQVFDVQLAGGDCLGYLPTQKAIDAGGYSTMIFSCYCGSEGGDKVVEKSVELVKSLF